MIVTRRARFRIFVASMISLGMFALTAPAVGLAGVPASSAGAGNPTPSAAASSATTTGEETVTLGRFGTVTLYHSSPRPSNVVLFVSGDGGWNLGVVDMARDLTALDALVAGVDITHYLKELESSDEPCSYPASDFEGLSKFIQKKLDYPSYVTPVLVGYSSGATLVYATLVQAPSTTFRGAMSLGFCPDLPLTKPFCPGSGLKWGPGPKGKGFSFLPATTLEVPWIALQGTIDQVCDPAETENFVKQTSHGEVVVLPKVGHGYSVPRNWMPQFKEAFATLVGTKSEEAPATAGELKDLPLIEVPTGDSTRNALAVHITGDGGWGVTDKGLAKTLADDGVPVVGLNALQYFWKPRSPEEAAGDLDRILQHYLAAWRKEKVVLIGHSFGADVLPFMMNRLTEDMQARVRLVALLGPSPYASFQFHLTDWVGNFQRKDSLPVPPEIEKIKDAKILCFYGEKDKDAICQDLDPSRVTSIPMGGGHRIAGRFEGVAQDILKEIQ